MHLQEESYVHNSLIGQTRTAASQSNVGVHCTNPLCSRELVYLRGGTLKLLEMESDPGGRPELDSEMFQMRALPKKYFWLCSECAGKYIVEQWTNSGIVLETRKHEDTDTQKVPDALPFSDPRTHTQSAPEDALLRDMRSIS